MAPVYLYSILLSVDNLICDCVCGFHFYLSKSEIVSAFGNTHQWCINFCPILDIVVLDHSKHIYFIFEQILLIKFLGLVITGEVSNFQAFLSIFLYMSD